MFEKVVIGDAVLYRGDCELALEDMKENEFDLAIVDPPYGINVNMNMGRRSGEVKKHTVKKWDNEAPSKEYFTNLSRASSNQIIWGANNFVGDLCSPSSGWIFWDKLISGDVEFSSGELAYTSFPCALKKVEIRIQSLYLKEPRIHPTQKPIQLYKWILNNYGKEGDHILDTHGGSMSSVVACLDMGFKVTVYEKDQEYFDSGCKRIEEAQRQQRFEF